MERGEAVVGQRPHELRIRVEELAQPLHAPERRRIEDVQLGTGGLGLGRIAVAAVERLAHRRRLKAIRSRFAHVARCSNAIAG